MHLLIYELFYLVFYFLDFSREPPREPLLIFNFNPLPNIFSIQKFPQKLFNLLRAKWYANCLKWLSRFFSRKFNFEKILKMEIIFNFQHPSQNPLLLKFCRINKYTLMHLLIFRFFIWFLIPRLLLWFPLWFPLKNYIFTSFWPIPIIF